eukprot:COSAG02_NODE_2602_length_8446_cov_64.870492_4_plen_82_part_00
MVNLPSGILDLTRRLILHTNQNRPAGARHETFMVTEGGLESCGEQYVKFLLNTEHPSDHLESLLFLADYSVNWHCFASAEG